MDHRPRAIAVPPRGPEIGSLRSSPPSTDWQPCYGVEIDPLSESFVVLLNPEGTRLLQELAPCRALFTVRRRSHVGALAEGSALRSSQLSGPPDGGAGLQLSAHRSRVLRDCRMLAACVSVASRFQTPELPPLFSQSMS